RLLATAGLGAAYHRLANKQAPDGAGTSSFPAAHAWRTHAPVTLPDPDADGDGASAPALPPAWGQMARRERLGAGLILPLTAGAEGGPFGALEAYFPPGAPPTPVQRAALQLAVSTLGAGLAQVQ